MKKTLNGHPYLFSFVGALLLVGLISLSKDASNACGVSDMGRPGEATIASPVTPPISLSATQTFSPSIAFQYALEQCAMGPRVTGTLQGWAAGDWIVGQLKAFGWDVIEQRFAYQDTPVRNIIGRKGQGPIVLIGAHYDTRPIADRNPEGQRNQPIVGANDGASGTAVLLELARVINATELKYQIWLAFFDAEDRGEIGDWPFAVGAEYLAAHLSEKPKYMILLDMVGDQEQNFYYEGNSNEELRRELWDTAARLGYEKQFIPKLKWTMIDDHLPFIRQGIPSVDIIDFDYPYWHTTDDTCDRLSAESLGRIGRVLEVWLSAR